MKCFLPFIVVLFIPLLSGAQTNAHQQGSIVRMSMAECLPAVPGFMAAISGAPRQQTGEICPEYILSTDKVVYVIVGKTSGQIIPLAESTEFRLYKNELLIRIDDAKHETRFAIREMTLRSDWERERLRIEEGEGEVTRPRLPLPASIEGMK